MKIEERDLPRENTFERNYFYLVKYSVFFKKLVKLRTDIRIGSHSLSSKSRFFLPLIFGIGKRPRVNAVLQEQALKVVPF